MSAIIDKHVKDSDLNCDPPVSFPAITCSSMMTPAFYIAGMDVTVNESACELPADQWGPWPCWVFFNTDLSRIIMQFTIIEAGRTATPGLALSDVPPIACPVFTGWAATSIFPPESNRCFFPVLRVSVALRTSAFHAAASMMAPSSRQGRCADYPRSNFNVDPQLSGNFQK